MMDQGHSAGSPTAEIVTDQKMDAALKTFMHTFPATPCAPAYEALSVRHGLNVYPVAVFEGRQCYAFGSQRVWGGKGRAYHNRMSIKFIDNGEARNIPAGEFAKKAKAAKHRDF